MERFTFHKEYYEVIQRLKKPQDRAALSLAVIEFVFDEKAPDNLSEVAEMAFHLLFPKISKSKNNSGRGGRPKRQNGCETVFEIKNRIETDLKPNENRNETELKPIENRMKTERETDPTKKERSKEKNNTLERENIPPLSPTGEGEKGLKSAKERFLDTYPTVKANLRYFKGDDSNVDYEVLIDHFSKSKELQGKYSLTWIVANYEGIKSGFFDDKDKPKNEQVEAADARAARERWYQTNKANAELQAEYVHDRFMKNEEFRTIEKRLNVMAPEIAKAELGAERGEAKAKKELVKLTQEQGRLKQRRLAIIELNGMTEEDLLPKWHCKKCSDTGYLPNGQACDCYSKR